MTDPLTTRIAQKALSRRGFLAGAGVATAATLTGCGGDTTFTPPTTTTPSPTAVSDVDVLNFALNLEYLEAEFYLRAVTGTGVPDADRGTGAGAVTIGFTGPVSFGANAFYKQIAVEFAQQELQHIRAIRATITALGGTPVACPALDYTAGFGGIASAAGVGTFNPYGSALNYFIGALSFEDVGVTAYTGAASLLTSKDVLNAAAGIQAAEAYHSASMRTLLAYAGDATAISNYNKVIGVRANLGGSNETTLSNGVNGTTVTASTIVQADSTNSVGFARTTDQVLHIVYGAAGVGLAKGGFFPNGLNGNIKATAS